MPSDPTPAEPSPGTTVTSRGVDFVLADTWGTTGIRLEVDWDLGTTDPEFVRSDGFWGLQLPRPAVDRFEYQFTVRTDNDTGWITDPGSPRTVPNPFGEKSEIRFPEYHEPVWLSGPEGGSLQSIPTIAGQLTAPVPTTLWAPDGLDPSAAAPLLVAHDGTDMATRGSLLRWATGAVVAGPFRIAMLDPSAGQRDTWYAASDSYADHLAEVVLPAIRSAVSVGPVIGLGASLGALSMLTMHRRQPGGFDGLALQSGSFFTADLDPQESGYRQFDRICAAVAEFSDDRSAFPVPVLMTCGTVEENRVNNERMAHSLTDKGYSVDLRVVRDAHTMVGWRDAWSPGLEHLLDAVRRGSRS